MVDGGDEFPLMCVLVCNTYVYSNICEVFFVEYIQLVCDHTMVTIHLFSVVIGYSSSGTLTMGNCRSCPCKAWCTHHAPSLRSKGLVNLDFFFNRC